MIFSFDLGLTSENVLERSRAARTLDSRSL
jgi:hypothetical protein